jgi:hypothetical protein
MKQLGFFSVIFSALFLVLALSTTSCEELGIGIDDLLSNGSDNPTLSATPIDKLPPPEAWQEEVAMVLSHNRFAEISRTEPDKWFPVRAGMKVYSGDRLRTLQDGYFEIETKYGYFETPRNIGMNSILVKVYSESLLSVPSKDKPIEGVSGYLEYIKGRFWMMIDNLDGTTTEKGERVKFYTPNAIAGIKQTELEIIVQSNATTVNVLKGVVEVSDLSHSKTLSVKAGESTTCTGNSGPSAVSYYNTDAVGQWWTDSSYEEDESSGIKPKLVQMIPVVASVAVLLGLLFAARSLRRRGHKHSNQP